MGFHMRVVTMSFSTHLCTPSTLCGTPSTLCGTPRTLCNTPSTLCGTPSTLRVYLAREQCPTCLIITCPLLNHLLWMHRLSGLGHPWDWKVRGAFRSMPPVSTGPEWPALDLDLPRLK